MKVYFLRNPEGLERATSDEKEMEDLREEGYKLMNIIEYASGEDDDNGS